MTVKRIAGITQFTQGINTKWSGLNSIVPNRIIVYSIDNKIAKLGDGTSTYENLPVLIDMNKAEEKYRSLGTPLKFDEVVLPTDVDKILIIGEGERINYGSITSSEIIQLLNTISSQKLTQDTKIVTFNNLLIQLFASLQLGNEGNIVVVSSGKYAPSGTNIPAYIDQLIEESISSLSLSLSSLKFYSEVECLNEVNRLLDGTTYYARIDAADYNGNTISYSLACTNGLVNIIGSNPNGSGIFQVDISENSLGNIDVVFNAVVTTSFTTRQLSRDIKLIDKESGFNFSKIDLRFFVDENLLNEITGNLIDGITYYAVISAFDENGFIVSNFNLSISGEDYGIVISEYGSSGNVFMVTVPEMEQTPNVIFEASCETAFISSSRLFNKTITDALGGLHFERIEFYTDVRCTEQYKVTKLIDTTVFFAKVIANDINGFPLTFPSLISTDDDTNIHISHSLGINSPIFEIAIDDVGADIGDITFTATISNGYASRDGETTISVIDGAGGLSIISLKFYSDSECTQEIFEFNEETTYYAKIVANDLNSLPIDYWLEDSSDKTVIFKHDANSDPGEFRVIVSSLSEDTLTNFVGYANNQYKELEIEVTDFPIINASAKLTIDDIKFYSDSNCSIEVDKLVDTGMFYAKVFITHDGDPKRPIIYQNLTSSMSVGLVTITHPGGLEDPVFQISIAELTQNYNDITFTATVNNGYTPSHEFEKDIDIVDASGGLSITGIKFYSDVSCETEVFEFLDTQTYWAIIQANDINGLSLEFMLSSNVSAPTVRISKIENNKFQILTEDVEANVAVEFTGTVTNGYSSPKSISETINIADVYGNIQITGLELYTDQACSILAEKIFDNATYYAKVTAIDTNGHDIIYLSLAALKVDTPSVNDPDTTVTGPIAGTDNVYQVDIGNLTANKNILIRAEVTNEFEIETVKKDKTVAAIDAAGGITITGVSFYTDAGLTQEVQKAGSPQRTVLIKSELESIIYYAKVDAADANGLDMMYEMTSNRPANVQITHSGIINDNVFQVEVVNSTASTFVDTIFAVNVDNGYGEKDNLTAARGYIVNGQELIGPSFNGIKIFSDSGRTTEIAPSGGVISLQDNKTYYGRINGVDYQIPGIDVTYVIQSSDAIISISPPEGGTTRDFTLEIGDNPAEAITGIILSATASNIYGEKTAANPGFTVRVLNADSDFQITGVTFHTNAACTSPEVTDLYGGKTYYAKVVVVDSGGNPITYTSAIPSSAAIAVSIESGSPTTIFRIVANKAQINGTVTNHSITFTYNNGFNPTTFTKEGYKLINGDDVIQLPTMGLFTNAGCTAVASSPLIGGNTYYAKIEAVEAYSNPLTYAISAPGVVFTGNATTGIFSFVAPEQQGSITFTFTANSQYGTKSKSEAVNFISYNQLRINSLVFYRDFSCTKRVTEVQGIPHLLDNTTYYAKIWAANPANPPGNVITYPSDALTTGSVSILSITQDTTDKAKFRVITNTRASGFNSFTMTAKVTDSYTTSPVTKAFTVEAHNYISKIGALSRTPTSYGERFTSIKMDSDGSFVAVGFTYISAGGNRDAIIAKFDKDLNHIAPAKRISGSGSDVFNDVAIIGSNYVVVGSTTSDGGNGSSALVCIFDKSLNLINKSVYRGSNTDVFNAVCEGVSGYAIAVGSTKSFGGVQYGLIARIRISTGQVAVGNRAWGPDLEFTGVLMDSADNNNIYIVGKGAMKVEGITSIGGLILKTDSVFNHIKNIMHKSKTATGFKTFGYDDICKLGSRYMIIGNGFYDTFTHSRAILCCISTTLYAGNSDFVGIGHNSAPLILSGVAFDSGSNFVLSGNLDSKLCLSRGYRGSQIDLLQSKLFSAANIKSNKVTIDGKKDIFGCGQLNNKSGSIISFSTVSAPSGTFCSESPVSICAEEVSPAFSIGSLTRPLMVGLSGPVGVHQLEANFTQNQADDNHVLNADLNLAVAAYPGSASNISFEGSPFTYAMGEIY